MTLGSNLAEGIMTETFYRAFEERHYAPRAWIKELRMQYLPFIQPLASLYKGYPTFDLGCGRGEWLEIMLALGFKALGMDLEAGMLADCAELHLPALQGDAVDYLRGLPDASHAVISAFHVVEHISFEQLRDVVREALRVLVPGGLLIMETPNPENISVGTQNFFLDPTHQRPIPSGLLSFVADFTGFSRVKVVRMQEAAQLRDPHAAVSLADVLTGVSPDYAVIAQKCAPDHIMQAWRDLFKPDYGLSLQNLSSRYDSQLRARFERLESALTAVVADLKERARPLRSAPSSVPSVPPQGESPTAALSFGHAAAPNPAVTPVHEPVLLYCHHTLTNPARSGIDRVVVKLAAYLARKLPVTPVVWNESGACLRAVTPDELQRLVGMCAPPHPRGGLSVPVLLYAELPHHSPGRLAKFRELIAEAHRTGHLMAAIFYDLIPVHDPAHANYREIHVQYLRALEECDIILAISQHAKSTLEAYWNAQHSALHARHLCSRVHAVALGEHSSATPASRPADEQRSQIVLLGTIEPRKQQTRFLRVFNDLMAQHAHLRAYTIRLFGSVHWASRAEYEAEIRRNPRIIHEGHADDDAVAASIRKARFTAFISRDEGFGLPIAESLALGVPCLTSNFGAMREVAAGGGCLCVNTLDDAALAHAILELTTGAATIDALNDEIRTRRLRTWDDYAADIADALGLKSSVLPPNASGIDPDCILQASASAFARVHSLSATSVPPRPRIGINLIGYISGNLGLGTYARHVAACLYDMGVEVAAFDMDPGFGRGGKEHVGVSIPFVRELADLPFDINLFVVAPPELEVLMQGHGSELKLDQRLNCALVFWELPVIPKRWRPVLQALDAILAPSAFLEQAFLNSCPVRAVVKADVPIEVPPAMGFDRAHFGLPQDGILFLTGFEPLSDPVRKNVTAVIDAFVQGVGERPDNWLIVKINNAHHAQSRAAMDAWRKPLSAHPRILVIEREMSHRETIGLVEACDVFVSLHRAEGFGLGPFEAMALGKPVIATGWSGNMSYMDNACACLVPYELIPAQGQMAVYRDFDAGDPPNWADPKVDAAADWIRTLATSVELRRDIGDRARAAIALWNERARSRGFWHELDQLRQRKQIGPHAPMRDANATQSATAAPAPLVYLQRQGTEASWAHQWIDSTAHAMPRLTCALYSPERAASSRTVDALRNQLGSLTWDIIDTRAEAPEKFDKFLDILRDRNAEWIAPIDDGDLLAPDAAFKLCHAIQMHPDWQLIYTDEDTITPDGQHVNPHCKPDFNLDYLRSLPYIGGLLLIRRDLFEALGGFDPAFEGAEDYDLLLRAWEHLQASGAGEKAIGHVAEVLYHRAQGSGHTRKSVPEILAAGQSALQGHFQRLGIATDVQPGPFPPSYRVRWPLPEVKPLVSILVPTRNQLGFLQRCVESVIEKTKYPAYEIIVIDNDSDDADTCRYLDAIEAREAELAGRLRVLRQPGPFNFSAMNNAAARTARGDYLLLLNNDTAALHDDWLDEMMGHAVRPDVGIVGAKLLYPDGKIQHAGVILGMRGPAEHPFIGRAPEDRGYFGRAQLVQDLSAVTGACLLVRKSVYEQVGGLDETDFKVSYNDIDLCLKVREAGLRIVFTPFALLLHEGSASQKGKVETAPDTAKLKRFAAEKDAMYRKWLPALAFDPAYNRHLSLASTDFLLDDQPCLSWDPEWRPRPRILVHPADREGCGEYRIISPMRALNRAGMTQGWETMRLFEPAEMQRMDPDVLVVQRQMEWPQIEAIERHGRYHRAFRVFEIDDLITNLPVKSVHKKQMHKDIAKRFRKAAGLCQRLVVATEPLAQAYAGFADEVVVCPNHVEGARWGHLQPARAERARPRVGWAGGVGHTGDLELIADVVRDTAKDVDWVFFGMCPDSLKGVVKEFHPGVPLDQYAAKLAALDLDLAVAPLEDNPFNDAKSHLRLLEYGILGYPVICSDLAPYQGDFPVTRVANRYRDWLRAIREAVSDRDALRAQGDALRDKVRAEWVLEDHLDRWMKAWTP